MAWIAVHPGIFSPSWGLGVLAAAPLNTVCSMPFGLWDSEYWKSYIWKNSTTTLLVPNILTQFLVIVTIFWAALLGPLVMKAQLPDFCPHAEWAHTRAFVGYLVILGAVCTTNQIPLSLLGWDTASISQHWQITPRLLVAVMLRADFSLGTLVLQVSPEHLGDGEHEGIMEDDTQGAGQKVRAKLARQCPEQEEAGALLLLQLPEELSLVLQSAPQRHTRRQGLLLPARGRECSYRQDSCVSDGPTWCWRLSSCLM